MVWFTTALFYFFLFLMYSSVSSICPEVNMILHFGIEIFFKRYQISIHSGTLGAQVQNMKIVFNIIVHLVSSWAMNTNDGNRIIFFILFFNYLKLLYLAVSINIIKAIFISWTWDTQWRMVFKHLTHFLLPKQVLLDGIDLDPSSVM